MRIQTFGFTPDDMSLGAARQVFESRIAAVTLLPPLLVGLIVGLRWANTRSTATALLRKAYNDALKPLHDKFLYALNKELVAAKGADGNYIYGSNLKLGFDYTAVRELHEYLDEEVSRTLKMVETQDKDGNSVISIDEARKILRVDEQLVAAEKPRLS